MGCCACLSVILYLMTQESVPPDKFHSYQSRAYNLPVLIFNSFSPPLAVISFPVFIDSLVNIFPEMHRAQVSTFYAKERLLLSSCVTLQENRPSSAGPREGGGRGYNWTGIVYGSQIALYIRPCAKEARTHPKGECMKE